MARACTAGRSVEWKVGAVGLSKEVARGGKWATATCRARKTKRDCVCVVLHVCPSNQNSGKQSENAGVPMIKN